MSTLDMVAAGVVLVGSAIFIAGVITILVTTQRRHYDVELAPIKGSPSQGLLWAFTLGLAPWAKESVRIHWLAYVRGIIFHLVIFLSAAYLIATPWLAQIPETLRLILATLFGIGALLGLAGFFIRIVDPIMRFLSTPDDYFALALTTLFLASAAMSAYITEYLPAFWVISGITMAYVPFGKLRHFIYFFYVRVFLGLTFGRRSVLE
jgi:nitrate reductase gamma subunit